MEGCYKMLILSGKRYRFYFVSLIVFDLQPRMTNLGHSLQQILQTSKSINFKGLSPSPPTIGSSLAALPLPLSLLLCRLPGTASNTWNLSPASAQELALALPSRGGTELLRLLPFEELCPLPFKLSAGSPPWFSEASLFPTLPPCLSLPLKPPPPLLLLLPLLLCDGTASNTGNRESPSTGQPPSSSSPS